MAAAGLILSFNVAAASAIVPSVARTFRVDEFLAGKIVWLYMLPYGLSALLYGPLARSGESKRILLFCIGGFSLANLLAGLAPDIYLLFTARVLSGLFGAAIIPLSLILIAQTSLFQERGRTVGRFFSLTFASSLAGLFLSGLIFWRWLFLVPAMMGALVWLGVYLYLPRSLLKKQRVQFNYLQAFADRRILRLFIYIFAISFIYHGIRQWLGVYFSTVYGLEQFLVSMLLTMVSLSGILGESLGGSLADRLGRIKIANIGVGLMLAALLLLLFKNMLFFLFAIMFIWGLGWTFNHAGISTFLTDLPQRHLYESASLNSSVRFLSGGVGALFGQGLVQRSFNLQFMVFAGCLIVLFIFSRKLIVQEA